MPSPITYRQVFDTNGVFKALQLVQGDNVISIVFSEGLDSYHGARWSEVKQRIEEVCKEVKQKVADAVKYADIIEPNNEEEKE